MSRSKRWQLTMADDYLPLLTRPPAIPPPPTREPSPLLSYVTSGIRHQNNPGARCRRSSRGMKLHVPVDRGVEQRLGSFQVLTSDSGYLYACRFKLHGADACVSGAVDRYRPSRGAYPSYMRRVVWEGMEIYTRLRPAPPPPRSSRGRPRDGRAQDEEKSGAFENSSHMDCLHAVSDTRNGCTAPIREYREDYVERVVPESLLLKQYTPESPRQSLKSARAPLTSRA
ncbi:hypothetical protein EVAR_69936_1 [Eumeta japonica]|uniref:Uncharacterized protein n=1 Tax=Eumeta variegata TaxID=151549 RepID=A0A4C2A938_EUMVA|nr:hypothetical protein EVAR_69936_1 [Eumeta japonica]